MSNMSYCRWQNTCMDFEDCIEHMFEEMSDDEKGAMERMEDLAIEFLTELGYEVTE